jgi:hypothetical protein
VCLFNLVLETVKVLRIRQWLRGRVFIVGLERGEYLLRRIAEIEDKRVFLARAGTV